MNIFNFSIVMYPLFDLKSRAFFMFLFYGSSCLRNHIAVNTLPDYYLCDLLSYIIIFMIIILSLLQKYRVISVNGRNKNLGNKFKRFC